MDSQRLDHRHTVSWDLGITDSRALSVCYDCLCLMALFRAVMSLLGRGICMDWARRGVLPFNCLG